MSQIVIRRWASQTYFVYNVRKTALKPVSPTGFDFAHKSCEGKGRLLLFGSLEREVLYTLLFCWDQLFIYIRAVPIHSSSLPYLLQLSMVVTYSFPKDGEVWCAVLEPLSYPLSYLFKKEKHKKKTSRTLSSKLFVICVGWPTTKTAVLEMFWWRTILGKHPCEKALQCTWIVVLIQLVHEKIYPTTVEDFIAKHFQPDLMLHFEF